MSATTTDQRSTPLTHAQALAASHDAGVREVEITLYLRDELLAYVMDRRVQGLPLAPSDHFFGRSSARVVAAFGAIEPLSARGFGAEGRPVERFGRLSQRDAAGQCQS